MTTKAIAQTTGGSSLACQLFCIYRAQSLRMMNEHS